MTTVTEPFGYFRATPFGWEDCADTDEGAKALYEITPEQALEALGWFSRLEIAQERIAELDEQKANLLDAMHKLMRDMIATPAIRQMNTAQRIDLIATAIAAAQPKVTE